MIERALLIALAAALALAGWQYMRAERGQTQWAQERAARQADLAAIAKAAVVANAAARTEEQRRTAAQQEIAHEADRFHRQAAVAAVGAASAADGLRQRAATLARTSDCPASNPAPADASPPAPAPGTVLADVLGHIADHAVSLAAIADQALIAGAACEAAYAALFDGQTPSR